DRIEVAKNEARRTLAVVPEPGPDMVAAGLVCDDLDRSAERLEPSGQVSCEPIVGRLVTARRFMPDQLPEDGEHVVDAGTQVSQKVGSVHRLTRLPLKPSGSRPAGSAAR